MKFLSGKDLPAERVRQQNDEYNIPVTVNFPFTVEDADVQPVGGYSLNVLPEGLRDSIEYTVFTKTPLQGASEGTDQHPDRIKIYGEWYSVVAVKPWLSNLDEYYLAYVKRETLR